MLVFSELVYLFNVRQLTASAFILDTLADNPVALWMAALPMGFQLLFTYTAQIKQIFQTAALDAQSWLIILALSSALFVAVEAKKVLLRRMHIRNI